ncbi:MAG: competence/damage-inducible protein A [Proteobacteria bacterium]|nr:competence/damage-inducible protein A [Pseudomonadota bacterium]
MQNKNKKAAIIIIGDEILSGRVVDKNSPFLIQHLSEKGIQVQYCVTIPDDPEIISETVLTYSQKVEWCFTSGGIGPTPDDITVASIARAFAVPVVRHSFLEKLIRKISGEKLTTEHLKMADIPEGAVLHETNKEYFPALQFNNIFILPGVPIFLQGVFLAIQDHFKGEIYPVMEIDLCVEEGIISAELKHTLNRFPDLKIGSYPCFDDPEICVKLVLEHEDGAYLEEAYEYLMRKVGRYKRMN